jgi:hypothetical protein
MGAKAPPNPSPTRTTLIFCMEFLLLNVHDTAEALHFNIPLWLTPGIPNSKKWSISFELFPKFG